MGLTRPVIANQLRRTRLPRESEPEVAGSMYSGHPTGPVQAVRALAPSARAYHEAQDCRIHFKYRRAQLNELVFQRCVHPREPLVGQQTRLVRRS